MHDKFYFFVEHWKLTRNDAGAFEKLLLSLLGYCLHSGTDNVAYDVTIQSQIEWAKTLRSFPSSHYISVVGKLETAEVNSWRAYELVGLAYRTATNLLRSEAPPRICGVDTSSWMHTGSDGLLTVYTQEYPRLFTTAAANSTTTVDSVCSGECNQRPNSCQMCLPSQSRSKNTKATAGAWPTHIGRQFSSTELYAESVQLERGVWHYTHRNISHLNAGLGCKETWGFLMQAVQVLAHSRNQQRLSVSPTSAPTVTVINGSVTTTMSGTGRKKSKSHRSCSSKDLPRIDRTLAVGTGGKPISTSPDMQSAAHLHLPCHHTSTAMAFRWSNLIFAAILASIIAVPHLYAFFLDRSDGMVISSSISLPSGLFILLCAGLFCSALFFLVALKPSPPSDASYFYFPNDSYLLAETAEIAYAMYRVACVSDMYFGAMLSSAPAWLFTAGSMSSTSILCEMLLLSLLPRPLFDFKNQPAAVLLGILLNFYPAPWIAAVRRGGNVLFLALGLECLAKLPWLVIYCTRREDNKSSGALLRRYCTLSSMLLYIACWGWFVCELWTLNNSFQSSVASAVDTTSVDGGGGMYTTFCVIFVLWAAYPLSKFQDLSECVQYVMIERYHY